MKKPKLKFEEVYVVEDWADDIKQGVGVFCPEYHEGISCYHNCWLVWFENSLVPTKVSEHKVFKTHKDALNKFEFTKKEQAKYYSKQIVEYTEKMKTLSAYLL